MIPKNPLFVQVDTAFAMQDYAPDLPCVRLVGISREDFWDETFNEADGCPVYLLDIPLHIFLAITGFAKEVGLEILEVLERHPTAVWFEIQYVAGKSKGEGSYMYELFSEDGPTYIDVRGIALLRGGPQVLPASLLSPPRDIHAHAELVGFHVGQGMCSLLRGGDQAILLDAGAGTPVKRADYRARGFPNALMDRLTKPTVVKQLDVVLSHPDSDHWKILEWDLGLLAMVRSIFLPTNVPSLATHSSRVKSKVGAIGDFVVGIGPSGDVLRGYRSQPVSTSRNSECIVSEVKIGEGRALLSGDYVYDEMSADNHPSISALMAKSFAAVVVPHHGARGSALSVPAAAADGAIAFFSAGTHLGYMHPTQVSIQAHSSRGYRSVVKNQCRTIEDVLLLT